MSQVVYNEGRVVGLSAWEIFKEFALGHRVPEGSVPNEQQWLTSMIGSGASMILKVPANTPEGINDFDLPLESNLAAAGVIIANPFLGECAFDSSGWATKVTSYSPLGVDNADSHPPVSEGDIPSGTYDPAYYSDMLSEFIKITDGIVFIKNATWRDIITNVTNTFTGNGNTRTFALSELAHEIVSVEINGSHVSSGYSLSSDKAKITFDTAPENEASISVEFYPYAPYKDIDPNFNNSSTVVRLYINATINHDVYILLTGFNNKRILQGLSGFAKGDTGGSADTNNNYWADGGMLGPQVMPWASKIVFSVPSSAYLLANSLIRTIPSDVPFTQDSYNIDGIHIDNIKKGEVRSSAIVDFNSIDINDYYTIHLGEFTKDPRLEEVVYDVSFGTSDSCNSIVAWYPGITGTDIVVESAHQSNEKFFPPAIYATRITSTGSKKLVPLDTAAPGTVKAFSDSSQAINYISVLPDNYAVYHDELKGTFSFVTSDTPSDWSSTSKLQYQSNPKVRLVVGDTTAQLISLTKSNGTAYDTSGSSGTISVGPVNNLTWDNILSALSTNKDIDILGTNLHDLGQELRDTNTIGYNIPLRSINAQAVNIHAIAPSGLVTTLIATTSNGTPMVTLDSDATVKVGTNFIEFKSGLRLYISTSAPSTQGVAVGSIGIGW